MDINQKRCSAVIVGNWNPSIFKPEWVKGRLTSSDTINVEIMGDDLLAPPRLKFDNLGLIVFNNKLILFPDSYEDDTLEGVQTVLNKILNDLPHTPVSALGINFHFPHIEPKGSLLNLFTLNDNDKISDFGCSIKACEIKRRVLYDGIILHLTLALDENDLVTCSFNFHWDVSNAKETESTLSNNSIPGLREKAYEFMRIVYDIDPNIAGGE